MNRKQFVILFIVVVAVGALGIATFTRRSSDWQTSSTGAGQKLLANLPVNDIAKVTIKQAKGALTLVKKDDGWKVLERGEYPANFNTIHGLITKMADLKVVQSDKIGASKFVQLELVPPDQATGNTGTLLEFADKSGKPIRSLLLGKRYMKEGGQPSPFGGEGGGFAAGRFVLDQANKDFVATVSDSLNNVEPKHADWLDKEFFKVERARSMTLTSQVASNSWHLSRETDGSSEWKLADANPTEQLDPAKTGGIAGPLASLSFSDVGTGLKAEESGLDKPTIVKVNTFDNFTYTLNIGKVVKPGEEELYPVTLSVSANLAKERTPGKDEKPEDKDKLEKEFKDKTKQLEEKLQTEKKFEKWTFLLSKWTVDSFLKERGQLLQEKKEEKPPVADPPKDK